MKKIFIILGIVFCATFVANAQNKTTGTERIGISVYVPQSMEDVPESAIANLQNKLNQIVTNNGISNGVNQRFILTPKISVLTKDITSTAPIMQAYTLDVTLYIGDGIDGKLFSSTSMTVKGVGETETKAYMNALKNIKTNSSELQAFIEKGKSKIVEYYNTNCSFIMKEAEMLAGTNNFEGALASLIVIPNASEDCYNKAIATIPAIWQKYIDKDCKAKLQEATAIWTASQNYESAAEAGSILASIDSDASCFGEVKALFSKIEKEIKARDTREWNYVLKTQQQESERIEAWRAVGTAYGNNQKQNTYNTNWIVR